MLILAPLVVLAAAVAWAAGLRRGAIVGGAAVIGLLLLSTIAGTVIGAREGGDGDRDSPDIPRSSQQPTATEPRVRQPDVVLALPADPFEAPAPLVALERLEDGDVRMVGIPFEGSVTLHQCRAGAQSADRCAAGVVAVAFDWSPGALVEFRTLIDTPAGLVDCTATACVLAAFEDTDLLLEAPLAFDGPTPPEPDVRVRPAAGVRARQDVTVTVGGLVPGASGRVSFCTAAEDATTATCREATAVELPAAGPRGEAATTLRLERCPRTDRCAVRVAVDGAALAYAEVAFASPPGPDLGGGQLAGGLAAAGALFITALVLLRRTDWTNPDGDPFTGIDVGHDDPFAGIDLDVDEWGEPWS